MKTVTTWKAAHRFESVNESNSILVDGDREEGFNPKAMLLTALGACSGIDVVDILTKMRVEFSGLQVEVEADQTEEHPRVFRNFNMHYLVRTDAANEEKVRKAINLSLEKYCGVAAMLRKNSPIHYELTLL